MPITTTPDKFFFHTEGNAFLIFLKMKMWLFAADLNNFFFMFSREMIWNSLDSSKVQIIFPSMILSYFTWVNNSHIIVFRINVVNKIRNEMFVCLFGKRQVLTWYFLHCWNQNSSYYQKKILGCFIYSSKIKTNL